MVGNNKRKKTAQKMRTGMKKTEDDVKKRIESNPYEVRKNKTTHSSVIGRNVKGNNRNVIVSNAKSLTQRQMAITQDNEKINKANVFKDRRFGAATTLQSMTEEEKMYKKMEIQRKKALKKQRFALGDDNEEEMLTHKGEAIDDTDFKSLRNDYQEEDDDVDEEFTKMSTDMLMRTNLPKQEESNPDRPKTQKEIMMEIIEKSKAFKEQRKREAEAVSNEIETIDAMMDDIHSLLSFSKDNPSKRVQVVQTQRDEEYDRLASQLVQEAKGKASDRQKSQEELDREEREKLEKLEKEREERMHGIVHEEARDTGDIQSEDVKQKKSDIDVVLDAIEEEAEMAPQEDRDADEDYELLFGKSKSKSKSKSKEEEMKVTKIDVIKKEKADRQAIIEEAKQEIPYVIDIPRGLSELCELLNEYVNVDDSVHLILARIIKSNNPNVNKDKKSDFINFYRNVINLVEAYYVQNCLNSYVLDCIQKCLVVMQNYIPANSVSIWSDMIVRIKTRVMSSTTFPRLNDIILLHLAINVFSATDFKHNIINSVVLLFGRILLECRIRSESDIVSAVYALGVVVDYSMESGRMVPEMYTALLAIAKFVLLNDATELQLPKDISLSLKAKGEASKPIEVASMVPDQIHTISRPQLQYTILTIIETVCHINQSNPAAMVYLKPLCQVLMAYTKVSKPNSDILKKVRSVGDQLVSCLNTMVNQRKHIPLQEEVLRPVYISFAPSYEENFTPGKILHPNKEHVKQRELRNQVKREKRGVEREMRREAEVIQNMRDSERREVEEQQAAKLKQVMGWLEEDQANYNRAVKKGVVTGGGSRIQNNLK